MRDVRMRGFANRTSVQQARAWVDEHALPLEPETVPLAKAAGRVLAAPMVSSVDVPSYARAMMDGYAVRAEDTLGAGDYDPRPLKIIGTALPARPAETTVEPGTAVRIMTGAPLPEGADAVLPVEQTRGDTDASSSTVLVLAPVARGRHIGQVGEDVRKGSTVLPAGRRLRPQDVGVLSSIGCQHVSVVRRPRVAILLTGNEVLPAGSKPEGYRIADANGPMLAALVERDDGEVTALHYVPDDRSALKKALCESSADVTLVSGGSSVGQEDFVPQWIAERGELAIHGIAMRPSSPAGMGTIEGRPIFLLPGNPVSCLCAYDFFAARLIRQQAGGCAEWPYPATRLPLAEKVSSAIGRTDYVRVRLEDDAVVPLAIRGASVLTSTTRADGFVVVPESSEGYAAGSQVTVYRYR